MEFNPVLAETRFGYGIADDLDPPQDVAAMLMGVAGEDVMAQRFEIEPFAVFFNQIGERRRLKQLLLQADGEDAVAIRQRIKPINQRARRNYAHWLGVHIQRRVRTRSAFRERLECFWANHFTAMGKSVPIRYGAPCYVESAVRPHLAGRFSDLLIAAATHPLMLHYLDQKASVGPESPTGRKTKRGLNENLAREVLELHTIGTTGPYGQADVRGLAELLTGLTSEPGKGVVFRSSQAQPGQKTILGMRYEPGMTEIHRALEDIAMLPATAAHVCDKLARYFISDAPPRELCSAMREAYLASGGSLLDVYEAMLSHDAAWSLPAKKMRMPFDYIASACRSLGVETQVIAQMDEAQIAEIFAQPMEQMGQDWLRPSGPDGFSDLAAAWVSPPGLAARLNWALSMPQRLMQALPEPRDLARFVTDAATLRAIAEAESRAHGLAIYLLSPALQKV